MNCCSASDLPEEEEPVEEFAKKKPWESGRYIASAIWIEENDERRDDRERFIEWAGDNGKKTNGPAFGIRAWDAIQHLAANCEEQLQLQRQRHSR